ncbi:MAG: RHS repeat-associated core domain-containing protein [Sedimenticola sp.]
MNGRIYDPMLGRFLSADPHVQSPANPQNLNRYTYVNNNPLSYTDPSGYFFKKLFKKIAKTIKKYIRPMLQIAAIYFGTPIVAAITSAVIVKADGGSWGDALKAGIISGATAFAFAKLNGLKSRFTKVVAHGVVGGLSSVASGGKFKHGFLSAGFTQTIAGKIDGWFPDSKLARVVASSVVGGTASKLGGGKFENGAVTGAFSYIMADMRSSGASLSNSEEPAYAPELTEEQLKVVLDELRQIPEFLDLEAIASVAAGDAITYKIGLGVGNMTRGSPIVEIGRYVRGYSYTASGNESMTWEQEDVFLASDVTSYVDKVQVPFSVQRVIVHELNHYRSGFFSNEVNVINATNSFMKKHYGEYNRANHEGFLIDKDRF